MSLDIRFSKINKTYVAGDVVSGRVVVTTAEKKALSHQGITVSLKGVVRMELSSSSVGRFEAHYNALKPIETIGYSVEIVPEGKFPPGQTELQFEFPLKPKKNQTLYDTYHGYYVVVQYVLEVEMKRGRMSKPIGKSVEFILEVPPKPDADKIIRKPIAFELTPKLVKSSKADLADFQIIGEIEGQEWALTDKLGGYVSVQRTAMPIRSVEMQLLRIETCGCLEGFSKDESEIQNIQIIDGDVLQGSKIPFLMTIPRLFTCSTVHAKSFKIEFELNMVVIFQDSGFVKRNFPITLYRDKNTVV